VPQAFFIFFSEFFGKLLHEMCECLFFAFNHHLIISMKTIACTLLSCLLFSLFPNYLIGQNRVPALASTVPDAYARGYLGALGAGGTLQSRTRLTGNFFDPDINGALGLGLGNPEKWLGLDIRLNIYGFRSVTGAPDNAGEGTLEFHLSRKITDKIWAAAGAYDVVGWRTEPPNELQSVYLSFTGALPLRPGRGAFLEKCYLTAGIGNGRFRTAGQYDVTKEGSLGVFGSAAFQVLPEGNFVLEWTGYNVFTGFSLFPFKKLPAQILLGVDDLFHENWRFVLAGSVGFYLAKQKDGDQYGRRAIMPPPAPQTSRAF
jgi:hypothetical protein